MDFTTVKKLEDGSFYSSIKTEGGTPYTIRLNNVTLSEGELSGTEDVWFTLGDNCEQLSNAEETILKSVKADPVRWFNKKVRETTIDSSWRSCISSTNQIPVTVSPTVKIFNKNTKTIREETVEQNTMCDIIIQVQGVSFLRRNFGGLLKLQQVQIHPVEEPQSEEVVEENYDEWVMDEYGFDE